MTQATEVAGADLPVTHGELALFAADVTAALRQLELLILYQRQGVDVPEKFDVLEGAINDIWERFTRFYPAAPTRAE